MKYFVNEIQNESSTTYAFDAIAEAQSKYHYILSFAATSDISKHGAIIYDNNATYIMSQIFTHSTEET